MHFYAHASYLYLAANLVGLIVGRPIPLEYNIAIIIFSIILDLDYFFNLIGQLVTTGKYRIPDHHHGWPSHWPIVYVPFVILALVLRNDYLTIGVLSIYVHLAMDTMFCNEGLMLFYPFSRKWYKFFSEKTKNKPGLKWNDAYSKLVIYRFDRVAFILMVIHFVIQVNLRFRLI